MEPPKLSDKESDQPSELVEPSSSENERPSVRRSPFDQALFIISLATLPYLFYGSMVGILVVLGRLIWRHRSPCLDPITRQCLSVSVLLFVLSTIDAYNPGESALQLANFLPYMVMFAYLPGLLRHLETLENLAIALVLTSIPINLIALGEFVLKAPFLPLRLQSIPWVDVIRKAPHRGRAMVMFDHPNVMASYLVVVLGLALGLLMMQMDYGAMHRRRLQLASIQQDDRVEDSRTSSRTSTGEPNAKRQAPQFSSGFSSSALLPWAIGLILLGLFCTGSRNGLAIAFSQLLGLGITIRADRRMLGAIATVIGVGATAIAGLGLGTRSIGIFDLSNDPRVGVWAIAIDLIGERPWLGWGLGNFKFLYPPRLIDPTYQDIFHPHNIWLLLSTEAGIPAMIVMSVFIGFICYRAIRFCLGNIRITNRGFPDLTVEWSTLESATPKRAIALGYLLAFWGCFGFALFDITFYDVRVNALNWTILAALYAIPYMSES
ncbi:MAG: O-antigen ligase family protein [Cyanobacteria bacterium J06627_8]